MCNSIYYLLVCLQDFEVPFTVQILRREFSWSQLHLSNIAADGVGFVRFRREKPLLKEKGKLTTTPALQSSWKQTNRNKMSICQYLNRDVL